MLALQLTGELQGTIPENGATPKVLLQDVHSPTLFDLVVEVKQSDHVDKIRARRVRRR